MTWTQQSMEQDPLPPENTVRWVARRKAAVVAAIADGRLTVDQACEKYRLTVEELSSWQCTFQQVGVRGLRATKIQLYRDLLGLR